MAKRKPKAVEPKTRASHPIRDRIRELRRVPASELVPNPRNWRAHPDQQVQALNGILAEVGFANTVIARATTRTGRLQIIDGHLRQSVKNDTPVPVLVFDVT